MSLNSSNYPTTPLSTTITATTFGTQSAAISSLSEFHGEAVETYNVRPAETPLMSILMNRSPDVERNSTYKDLGIREKVGVNFPSHTWKEIGEENIIFAVSSNATNSATTLVFASTAGLRPGFILRNTTTNEQLRITSINSNGTDIVVIRGVGSTPAAAITTAQKLQLLGSAGADGTILSNAVGIAAGNKTNFYQKFETAIRITDFDQARPGAGGTRFAATRQMKESMAIHARELERQLLFGEKADITAQSAYAMGGVIEHARAGWTHDISSSLTLESLMEVMQFVSKYGNPSKKVVLCGPKAFTKIQSLLGAKVRPSMGEFKGVQVLATQVFDTGTGTFSLVQHPSMDADSGYDGHVCVVDADRLQIAYCPQMEPQGKAVDNSTRFYVDQSISNSALFAGNYKTWMTLERVQPNAFGLFKLV